MKAVLKIKGSYHTDALTTTVLTSSASTSESEQFVIVKTN